MLCIISIYFYLPSTFVHSYHHQQAINKLKEVQYFVLDLTVKQEKFDVESVSGNMNSMLY